MFFPCTIKDCQKLFNCKKALKEHERTHNQDRPFKWYKFDYFILVLTYIVVSYVIRHLRNTRRSKSMLGSTTRRNLTNAITRDVTKPSHR